VSGWEVYAVGLAVVLTLVGLLVWQARSAGGSRERAKDAEEERDATVDAGARAEEARGKPRSRRRRLVDRLRRNASK
jgi:hypothetical protein